MRILLMAVLAGAAAPVAAQSVQPFVACAGTVDDAARLACYDKAVDAVSSDARRIGRERDVARREAATAAAAAAAQAAEEARAAAAAAERDRFGREAGGGDRIDEVSARVSETLSDSQGRHVFVLDNGQLWRQVDAYRIAPLRAGSEVTISRGSLGSYFLRDLRTKGRTAVIRMR
jgi:hypothetical protein